MSWRPPKEVWDKLLKDNNQWVDKNSVEAGADIMLEALQAKPAVRLHNKLKMMEQYIIQVRDLPNGIWRVLLIPEE